MKITHLYHSGFAVELEECVLIFDWYTGDLPAFPADKALYVLVSHKHQDHYGRCIWPLQDRYPNITYILDKDVPLGPHKGQDNVHRVRRDQSYDIGALHVRTLRSTDTGVAFYVEAEGRRIYHSGDLNVWYWDDEPLTDNNSQERRCRQALEGLKVYLSDRPRRSTPEGFDLDVGFFPLDPRLGEHAPMGMALFAEILCCAVLVPMHYWDRQVEAMAYTEDARLAAVRDRLRFDDSFRL